MSNAQGKWHWTLIEEYEYDYEHELEEEAQDA